LKVAVHRSINEVMFYNTLVTLKPLSCADVLSGNCSFTHTRF